MTALLAARALLARIPSWAWITLAGLLLAWAAYGWHAGKVNAAFKAGAAGQLVADTAAVANAERAATAKQQSAIDTLKPKQAEISKGTDDALIASNTDLANRYDALRLRWEAYRADQGRASQGAAVAAPGATSVPDNAYCPSQGWVSIDTAAAAAQAADEAIAKDDAWREWWQSQAAAWPQ